MTPDSAKTADDAQRQAVKALAFLVEMADQAVHHHLQIGSVEKAEKKAA